MLARRRCCCSPTGGSRRAGTPTRPGSRRRCAYGDVVDEATLERYLAGRLATTGVTDAAFAVAASVAGADLDELDGELDGPDALAPRSGRSACGWVASCCGPAAGRGPSPALDGLDGCQQPIVLGALAGVAGGGPVGDGRRS